MRALGAIFLCVNILAGVLPWAAGSAPDSADIKTTLPFPEHFEGRELIELPLAPRELRFSNGFPGEMKRFTDGERELLIRTISRPTRKLHPSADCFKGAGYAVEPIAARVDRNGKPWGCFQAKGRGAVLKVCEQISDRHGVTWYDVSSWFWDAALGRSSGPWQAVTLVG